MSQPVLIQHLPTYLNWKGLSLTLFSQHVWALLMNSFVIPPSCFQKSYVFLVFIDMPFLQSKFFFHPNHCSIPNVSHGPKRWKRSSPGHRQVTHMHSFGHKTWRHVAWWNQIRELHKAWFVERHADMRGCLLSGSKMWRGLYARSRVLFSELL